MDDAGVITFEETALQEELGAEEEDIAERGNEAEKAVTFKHDNKGTVAEEDSAISGRGGNVEDGCHGEDVVGKLDGSNNLGDDASDVSALQ